MGIRKYFAAGFFLLLAGCTVGPDFMPPHADTPSSFLRDSNSAATQIKESEAVDPKWWGFLHDPLLDRLVETAVAENLDIRTATVRMEESRAQRGIAASEFFPQLNGDASYMREKLSDKGVISLVGGGGAGASAGGGGAAGLPSPATTPPFNLYQYGLDVSWEIDLWGRIRRSVEAADANLQASADDRRGLTISRIAELVGDYVQLRGAQLSLAAIRKDLADARKVAGLVRDRYKVGLSTDIDVANADAQAASTESQIPPLEQRQTMLANAIALLLAQPPGAFEAELAREVPMPPIPPRVPIGLPSDLLRRRPDIREAEDQLHAATAEIGVAEADFFPSVTLMGNGMLQSLEFDSLNTWAAHSYTIGPSVSLPIFTGGRLTSTLDMRTAQQQEAALQYRKIVLTAFHEVDNALTAFRAERHRHDALQKTVEEDRKALALAVDRYKQGLSDFVAVLTDEENLLAADEQSIQSATAVVNDIVQLYKALGGGWETNFPENSGQSSIAAGRQS